MADLTRRVLLTGSGGFIGHHVLEHLLVNTDWRITVTDSFRHRGITDRVSQVLGAHPGWRSRVHVLMHDLRAPFSSVMAESLLDVDYVLAVASESHVDRSIKDPVPFVENNVAVMLNTLELCRQINPLAVLVVSTDEVYGPCDPLRGPRPEVHGHPEWSPIIPSNPYSASKAAQEAIAIAYWRTYGVPVILTNTMNVIGERQDGEKFLPTLIRRISDQEPVSIHGRPNNIGTRHYLHARNAASAWVYLLEHTLPAGFPLADRPDRWNVAGPEPISNLDLALEVAAIIGRDLNYQLVDFHAARPGHDPHYGLDGAKLAQLGWKPPVEFHESLERTVRWSLQHPEWLQ
jgi:dTDP-glucose 4,6-dehydratase